MTWVKEHLALGGFVLVVLVALVSVYRIEVVAGMQEARTQQLIVRCQERNSANGQIRQVFTIENEVLASMSDPDIIRAFNDLVSPEAIDSDCDGDGVLTPSDYEEGP